MSKWGERVFLITGVSRPAGIGATIARRLAEQGAEVIVHGYSEYDIAQEYCDASLEATAVMARSLQEKGWKVRAVRSSDLAREGEAEEVVDAALLLAGRVTDLVVNHAYSTAEAFGEWTMAETQAHFQVNVTATMMLVQRFAHFLPDGCVEGAITLMTSGQYLGPMVSEVAYATSKEAIRNLATHLAVLLAPRGIRVNCVNPGPTDTGYLSGEAYEEVRAMFPTQRWGTSDDVSRLVEFLHSKEGAWIIGQTVGSEGGFDRYR